VQEQGQIDFLAELQKNKQFDIIADSTQTG